MYAIANVVLGTILPWDVDEILPLLDCAYAPSYDIYPGDAVNLFVEETLDDETRGWTREYHGTRTVPSAFVGVRLAEFDESNHVPLSTLVDLKPTDEQMSEARRKYDALPEPVRAVLPPFGTYVLWSSS
jgi:hypothetical protein